MSLLFLLEKLINMKNGTHYRSCPSCYISCIEFPLITQ